MANATLGNLPGFTDKRATQGNGAVNHSTPANYASVTAMRARLTAVNAGLYTSAYLDKLTVNDLVYAVRVADDAASI